MNKNKTYKDFDDINDYIKYLIESVDNYLLELKNNNIKTDES